MCQSQQEKVKKCSFHCAKSYKRNLTSAVKSAKNRYVVDFASVLAGRVTTLVTARSIPLPAWEKAGRIKFFELYSAYSGNYVLTLLCSGGRLSLL